MIKKSKIKSTESYRKEHTYIQPAIELLAETVFRTDRNGVYDSDFEHQMQKNLDHYLTTIEVCTNKAVAKIQLIEILSYIIHNNIMLTDETNRLIRACIDIARLHKDFL